MLNHRSVTHGNVTAIYDRYRYDKEKRAARQKWAEALMSIVGSGASADKTATSVAQPAETARTANRRCIRRMDDRHSRVVSFTSKSAILHR